MSTTLHCIVVRSSLLQSCGMDEMEDSICEQLHCMNVQYFKQRGVDEMECDTRGPCLALLSLSLSLISRRRRSLVSLVVVVVLDPRDGSSSQGSLQSDRVPTPSRS